MSHTAIAAVLARTDLAMGERLVALSLASFANRDDRAFPGNAAAAARAGLCRSRYLEARQQLLSRGLIAIYSAGRGRGQSTTLTLLFAGSGPWWEGEINARLLERVLDRSSARGPARVLLATLAALADESGSVDELCTDDLCRAAGLANSTYRRARTALLATGEVELVDHGGGRSRINRWRVLAVAGGLTTSSARPRRRRAPAPGQPPLLSPARTQPTRAVASQARVAASPARPEKGPDVSGVTGRKGPALSGVFGVNPAETPPETPPPNARAGREPLNPRIRNPPNPPEGESSAESIVIQQSYMTQRGRNRRRAVRVDLNEVGRCLELPTRDDCTSWEQVRALLLDAVGETTFEIWLAPIELVAIDNGRALVLGAPDQTTSWLRQRFGRLLSRCAERAGREWRLASEPERRALQRRDERHPAATRALRPEQQEAS